jgi:organic radical activating enzyme
MRGQNPIRKPEQSDGQQLALKAIFPTLQGEGPFAGVPALFIRLGGCNLACDFCDTDFEDFVQTPIADILAQALPQVKGRDKLVVITGGEPLRQNIVPLCEALIAAGCTVQIETNGTLYQPLPEAVQIICSPKSRGAIRGDLLPKITAFKFIISDTHVGYQDVPDVGQGEVNTIVYVQPMDEYDAVKNVANMQLATQLALEHGYRLSLQTHKILGIA